VHLCNSLLHDRVGTILLIVALCKRPLHKLSDFSAPRNPFVRVRLCAAPLLHNLPIAKAPLKSRTLFRSWNKWNRDRLHSASGELAWNGSVPAFRIVKYG
jgi:hypothetical protein